MPLFLQVFLSNSLTTDEKKVYDMVARRFISAFYPDCKVSNVTVLGEVNQEEFKATGKQILEPGWRVVFKDDSGKATAGENILPLFEKGEHGPHEPELAEKMTQPPKHYTEATLLRAMETAGKSVDDEELRDLLKQNGIGRPSTRANIIETLFRRKYIRRDKKKIIANPTGIELIQTIENELLKSAELTGIWEKKLREIEAGKYEISAFMIELKEMVTEIVRQVKQSPMKMITVVAAGNAPEEIVSKSEKENKPKLSSEMNEKIGCPKCKKGMIIKGKTAWGCAEYRSGCKFLIPFVFMGKTLSDSQMEQLILKGKTSIIIGFTSPYGTKRYGRLLFDKEFKIILE